MSKDKSFQTEQSNDFNGNKCEKSFSNFFTRIPTTRNSQGRSIQRLIGISPVPTNIRKGE